jgi:DNA-binding CsgD family transcriptional regulator
MGLAERELRDALQLVWEVQSAPDLESYRSRILGVRRLVPGNVVGYNEVDADGTTYAVLDPPEAAFPGVEDVFARYAHENPVLRHVRESGDPSPRAISDFLSEAEFHLLDLYRHVYAPMGVEDQMVVMLPAADGTVIGVAINRAERGFSAEERELLGLIRPHLGQAFRDVTVRSAADPLSPERLARLGLTDRQIDVARQLAAGASASEIAERLVVSPNTVRKHVANIYTTLGVHSRGALLAVLLLLEQH